MPMMIVWLAVALIVTATISGVQTLVSDRIYYNKIQTGFVTKRQMKLLAVLRYIKAVGYALVGSWIVAMCMYVMLLIQTTYA